MAIRGAMPCTNNSVAQHRCSGLLLLASGSSFIWTRHLVPDIDGGEGEYPQSAHPSIRPPGPVCWASPGRERPSRGSEVFFRGLRRLRWLQRPNGLLRRPSSSSSTTRRTAKPRRFGVKSGCSAPQIEPRNQRRHEKPARAARDVRRLSSGSRNKGPDRESGQPGSTVARPRRGPR